MCMLKTYFGGNQSLPSHDISALDDDFAFLVNGNTQDTFDGIRSTCNVHGNFSRNDGSRSLKV